MLNAFLAGYYFVYIAWIWSPREEINDVSISRYYITIEECAKAKKEILMKNELMAEEQYAICISDYIEYSGPR